MLVLHNDLHCMHVCGCVNTWFVMFSIRLFMHLLFIYIFIYCDGLIISTTILNAWNEIVLMCLKTTETFCPNRCVKFACITWTCLDRSVCKVKNSNIKNIIFQACKMECNSVWRFGRICVWMSGNDGAANSKLHEEILQQNVTASVCDLNRRRVMQHDFYPKHWSKSKLQRKQKMFCIL